MNQTIIIINLVDETVRVESMLTGKDVESARHDGIAAAVAFVLRAYARESVDNTNVTNIATLATAAATHGNRPSTFALR